MYDITCSWYQRQWAVYLPAYAVTWSPGVNLFIS